jgi:hypothetical protein
MGAADAAPIRAKLATITAASGNSDSRVIGVLFPSVGMRAGAVQAPP